jgi:FtsH-binding integral membrane protein
MNMSDWLNPQQRQAEAVAAARAGGGVSVAVDAGLRAHMLKVYNYMTSAVLLTGVVAMLFARTEFAQNLMVNPSILSWVIIFAPLIAVMAMSFGLNRMSTSTLQLVFWGFAVLMGLSMARIFMIFSGESIAQTFFATAAAFAGLSLWGYTTKKDLSGWGSFLIMGVVGLFVASIINIFLASATMGWVISSLGVLIFAGLTAYDTQKIKSIYFEVQGSDMLGKAAIMGALNLYLDFVNMFQFLLSFMGGRD